MKKFFVPLIALLSGVFLLAATPTWIHQDTKSLRDAIVRIKDLEDNWETHGAMTIDSITGRPYIDTIDADYVVITDTLDALYGVLDSIFGTYIRVTDSIGAPYGVLDTVYVNYLVIADSVTGRPFVDTIDVDHLVVTDSALAVHGAIDTVGANYIAVADSITSVYGVIDTVVANYISVADSITGRPVIDSADIDYLTVTDTATITYLNASGGLAVGLDSVRATYGVTDSLSANQISVADSITSVYSVMDTVVSNEITVTKADFDSNLIDTVSYTGTVNIGVDQSFVIGDPNTDGAYQFIVSGDSLFLQKRVTGSWVRAGAWSN